MPAPTLSFVLYCNLQFQRPSINLNFMLPPFTPSRTLPPSPIYFSRRALIRSFWSSCHFIQKACAWAWVTVRPCDVVFKPGRAEVFGIEGLHTWSMTCGTEGQGHVKGCYWWHDAGICTLNRCWTWKGKKKSSASKSATNANLGQINPDMQPFIISL